MADVVASNGRDALRKVAHHVLDRGVEVSPRGMLTREVEHFTVKILDPYDILCTGINADQSTRVAAAETVQLIGGFSDPAFAIRNAPKLAAFVNEETNEFDGAYGPRVGPQLDDLVSRLKSDTDTRQAILSIWSPADLARPASRDYPCTLNLGFAIRRDRLNLSVVMRSNDVNWGFKNDIFQFTQLQLTVARLLGIEAGKYQHTAFSMHLYERDFGWAKEISSFVFAEIPDHPTGIEAPSPAQVRGVAQSIARRVYHPFNPPATNRWYVDALRPEVGA